MSMEIGENPREFIMRVDSTAKELRRLGKTVDEDDIVVVILNGVSSEYDIEVRLLECGDDVNPPRNKILQREGTPCIGSGKCDCDMPALS